MTTITYYEQASWGTHNKLRQEELQRMVKTISESCKLIKVGHNGYSTSNPEQTKAGEEVTCILDGSVVFNYESEYLPIKYVVHTRCGLVTEIIEMINE